MTGVIPALNDFSANFFVARGGTITGVQLQVDAFLIWIAQGDPIQAGFSGCVHQRGVIFRSGVRAR
mgnify:CR=1 FL=1